VYGVLITPEEAQSIVDIWRDANPWARKFWADLFTAAKAAVMHPGTVHTAGRVKYMCSSQSNYMTLWCLLPCGRLLAYPDARYEYVENKWGDMEWQLTSMKASLKPRRGETVWPRMSLWHGIFAENATQAICASLLRDAIRRMEAEAELKYPIVLHTHDEIALEVEAEVCDDARVYLEKNMNHQPDWAPGFPIATEIWTGPRYRK